MGKYGALQSASSVVRRESGSSCCSMISLAPCYHAYKQRAHPVIRNYIDLVTEARASSAQVPFHLRSDAVHVNMTRCVRRRASRRRWWPRRAATARCATRRRSWPRSRRTTWAWRMYTAAARALLPAYGGYECKEPEPGKFTLAFSARVPSSAGPAARPRVMDAQAGRAC